MSRLAQLIEELCPNGAVYKTLGEICETYTPPKKIATKDIIGEGKYPVIDQGAIFISGYTNDKEAVLPKYEYVIFGDHTETVKYVDFQFAQGADGIKILQTNSCMPKYLYYSFVNFYIKTGKYTRHWSVAKETIIPVPPLPVQREIVSILDKFTELTTELAVELADRKKQYKYYSTALFDNAKKSGVGFIKDICCIEKGKTPIQKAIPGEYPMVVTTTERKSCNSYQFDTKAVCIPLVSSRGHGVASLNHVYYQEGKFALGNILCALIPKDEAKVFPKYLYYYFEQTKDYTLVPLMKGGANVALHMKDIDKLKIPIPPLSEQQRIVNILDRFDSLCNDISNGLPAEIDERQKQYEYYRDKLLTFKNINAEV